MSNDLADRHPSAGRKRAPLIIASVVAVAILGGAAVALLMGHRAGPSEIRQEPVLTAGESPFMPTAGTDRTGLTSAQPSGGTFGGGTPGLYGGTMNNSACDRDQMARFLEANPDQQSAWAQAQGLNPTEVSGYLRQLTPAVLRSDTLATDHGFAGGHASTVNAALQAGSAVLLDNLGVPRARCYSGNPLTPSTTVPEPSYSGQSWPGFSASALIRVEPAPAPIDVFTLVDPGTEAGFSRPAGTAGDRDGPLAAQPSAAAPPPPSVEAPPPAPAPPTAATDLATTAITFKQSDNQVGTRVHFTSGVRNLGDAPSGNFTVTWLVNGKDVGAQGSHSGVAAHATDMAGNSQFDSTFNSAGTYKITFIVDSGSVIPDANRANNSTSATIEIAPKLDPHLDASPKSGSPGTTVTVKGTGFKPDEKVSASLSGSNSPNGGGSTTTNANGEFAMNFKIHDPMDPGDITITFKQDGISESVKFKVTK